MKSVLRLETTSFATKSSHNKRIFSISLVVFYVISILFTNITFAVDNSENEDLPSTQIQSMPSIQNAVYSNENSYDSFIVTYKGEASEFSKRLI